MLTLNFSPFPVLTTTRLVLRQLVATDAAALIALRNNEMVNQYLGRPKNTSQEGALLFIDKITQNIATNEALYWVIALKENNELIGTICLWNIDTANNTAEIGYELLPDFHGKKIMQEAIETIIDFGFNTIQLQTITAFTVTGNIASSKLLERNNFKPAISDKYIEEPEEGHLIYVLARP